MSCVYALVDKKDPSHFRYVGRYSNDCPDGRLADHQWNAKRWPDTKSHVYNWMQQAGIDDVTVQVIESGLSWRESGTREVFFINHYKSLGHKLTNMTLGGDGRVGCKHSEETKAKMSAAHMGRKKSEETKAKMRKPKSAEHNLNIGKGNVGKPKSAEHKAAVSEGLRKYHAERQLKASQT